MKILFDHQIFSTQNYGGISRYFCELIKYLGKNANVAWDLALKYSENTYLKNSSLPIKIHKGQTKEDFCFGIQVAGKGTIHRALTRIGLAHNSEVLNKVISIEKINERKFDIFHPTNYDNYFLSYLKHKPFVLTIYDMIHELYSGKYFRTNDSTIGFKRSLAERADKILAISENTKKDILRFYRIDEKKISVVHLASSLCCTDDLSDEESPLKYILFIGDRCLYKNFQFFLKAIAPLLAADEKLLLICGGSLPFNRSERILIKALGFENKVIFKSIQSDVTLTQLYKNALCFVFPSIYEGFGIPVLEAFSCGCPVVLSHTSSFPEIAGDAGEYFDPMDANSIHQIVKKVIYNVELRNKMIFKGYLQLKNFSWEKTALETVAVYKTLI